MKKTEIQQVKQRFGIIGNTEALLRAIDVAIQVAPIQDDIVQSQPYPQRRLTRKLDCLQGKYSLR